MRKWKLKIFAAIIEWHWLWIKAGQKKGNTMLEQGVALSSPKLLRLSGHITRHGMKVMRATKAYEDLCGLTAALNQGRCKQPWQNATYRTAHAGITSHQSSGLKIEQVHPLNQLNKYTPN